MMWQTWTNIVLGTAVVAVAFAGLTETTLIWTLSAIGIVIIIVELLEANDVAKLATKQQS